MSEPRWPQPHFDPLELRCKACGTEWQEWLPQHVRAKVMVAAMRSYQCPSCGSKRGVLILLVRAFTAPLAVLIHYAWMAAAARTLEAEGALKP